MPVSLFFSGAPCPTYFEEVASEKGTVDAQFIVRGPSYQSLMKEILNHR
ncbi:MAG TPA: hypothetical protein VED17_08340 [Nitrososphaerales archaeon]|nr:hypothetical protein [Nitrososphaerales archaeon]